MEPMTTDLAALIARAEAGDIDATLRASAELTRAGKHELALNYLIRASNGGHVVAQATLGLRMVTGRMAQRDPVKGIDLIRASAIAGNPEALSYLSSLAASGLFGPADWSTALMALARAAERKLASAEAQLKVLHAAGLNTPGAIMDFVRASNPRVISEAPRIVTLEGLLPHDFCAHWISHTAPKLSAAHVYDAEKGGRRTHGMRSNTGAGFSLLETDMVMHLCRARIASAIKRPVQFQEAPNVLHYAVGETFSAHFDYLAPENPNFQQPLATLGQRVCTALVYLNDDFDAGETRFLELDRSIRCRTGGLLAFDNVDSNGAVDPKTLHEGVAPTRGEKWLLSVWVRDRPQPII
jgi:hypothetical protein